MSQALPCAEVQVAQHSENRMLSRLAQSTTVLRETILQGFQARQASPEQAAVLRTRQFRSAVSHLFPAAASTLVLLIAALVYFWPREGRATLLTIGGLLSVSTVYNLFTAARWNRQATDTPIDPGEVRALATALGLCAGLWGLLAVHCMAVGDPAQQVMVVGVTASMIATGAWMYTHLPPAAIAWVLGLSIVSTVGLISLWSALAVMMPLYAATLVVSILLSSRVFVQRIVAEQELAEQRQVVGLLLRDFELNASDWLWETDAHGRLRHVSVRLAQALDVPAEQLLDQPLAGLLARHEPPPGDPAHGLHGRFQEKLQHHQPFRDVDVAVMLNGERRWWSLTANPLRATNGGITGWRGVGSDVTVLRERAIELTRLANVDTLTGLANRHHFGQALASCMTDAAGQGTCALFMLDLDNFKAVNDSLGHAAGDDLLSQISQRLQSQVPPGSLLARLGGDEFALIVPGCRDRSAAETLGERLQTVMAQPCLVQDHLLKTHASVGVAFAPADAQTAQHLVQLADMALYAAKAAGRRTLRFFERHMETDARDKLQLLADLSQAVQGGQLFLHYQPQIDLAERRLLGFEALVRWQHPTRGTVPPSTFIPLAEDSGLIVSIGQWVLRQACNDAAAWPGDLRVAVNVSAVEFERGELRESVREALRCSALAASRLEVELTESTLLQDSNAAIALLRDLRGSGVRVALDDFGTGFSSLAYLRTFPLDNIKIDRSFVRTLDVEGETDSSVAIVRAVQSLAVALGLQTTAEGVETARQSHVLQDIGCHVGQGYLYARPMDVRQTRTYIEAYRSKGLSAAMACESGAILAERPSSDVLRDAQRIAAGRGRLPALSQRGGL
jgi:diguanylate cyclase (GGDEF)-like protein